MAKLNAIVVCSGGMDSTTAVYDWTERDYQVDVLSFDYGQRHKKELQFAAETAEYLGLRHDIIDISSYGNAIKDSGSALVGGQEVPEGHYAEDNMRATVVPNRNMVMLSMAVGVAVARNAQCVVVGIHAGDHYQYPDCRPEFRDAVGLAASIGNEGFLSPYFSIEAPYVYTTKAEIAKLGHSLGVKWEMTWSCYKGGDKHCGKCGTCVERAEAFYLAEVTDPTDYEDSEFWKSVTKEHRKV